MQNKLIKVSKIVQDSNNVINKNITWIILGIVVLIIVATVSVSKSRKRKK